jgi:hypothetical protein
VDIGLWTSGETGPVTFVADGDTIDVDVAGDGTSTSVRVRIAGIQHALLLGPVRGHLRGRDELSDLPR